MIITVWETWQKGEWNHSHIEDGFDPDRKSPEPKSPAQRGWPDQTWRGRKAYLVDSKVVMEDEA